MALIALLWIPEITHHCPGVPFLLVGCKADFRDNASTTHNLAKTKQEPISVAEAEHLARHLRAVQYVECSALTHKGVKNVFDEAIITTLDPPTGKQKNECHIS